jgi:OmpA-OmpF porin, OOP family
MSRAPGRRCARAMAVALLGVVAGFLAGGCAGARLEAKTAAVADLVETARTSGAERCAPVELALAESHVDFARQELSEGRYYQARDALGVAETNAHTAVRKSPKALCAPEPRVDSDGDGLDDSVDACPREPEDKDGFEDDDGCPDLDNDGDGIPDSDDACPMDAEDKDGFEDDDGCPDPDNDKDGIEDALDRCPDAAEDRDGFEDEDGCPDCDNDGDGVPECPEVVDMCPDTPAQTADGCPEYKLVTVTENKIELKQSIYFATNKATIKRVSYALLDEVAQALIDNPTIRVRIEGHTDSRGRDSFNMRLSQARTESVREYLLARGIAPERMEAQGFGESVPIADNRTEAGRAQNRRVDFVITDR